MGYVGGKFPSHLLRHVGGGHIPKHDKKTGLSVGEFDFIHHHAVGFIEEVHGVFLPSFGAVCFADNPEPVFVVVEAGNAAVSLVLRRMEDVHDFSVVVHDFFVFVQKDNAVGNGVHHGADGISFFFDVVQVVLDFIMLFFHLSDQGFQFLVV